MAEPTLSELLKQSDERLHAVITIDLHNLPAETPTKTLEALADTLSVIVQMSAPVGDSSVTVDAHCQHECEDNVVE